MMYLVPKQLYSGMIQNREYRPERSNHTEFGSAENVKIYNNSCATPNGYKSNYGAPGSDEKAEQVISNGGDMGDGLGVTSLGDSILKNSSNIEAHTATQPTPMQQPPSSLTSPSSAPAAATPRLKTSIAASTPPPTPQMPAQHSSPAQPSRSFHPIPMPTVMPEQAPQSFYPQQPIIIQSSATAAQAKVPDPEVAGPDEVQRLIPNDGAIPGMTPIIQESHNIIKDMLIDERLKMMEMMRGIKEDINIQQKSIETNARNIQSGQINTQKIVSRMSDMLNDNFNDVQRSLEVQKGLIREHIASTNMYQTQQRQQPSLQSQFDSLEQRLAMNMKQAFNPILNQLEAESRVMKEREQQLWARNFDQLRNDISELNANQFRMMHDELKAHYALWSNEIQTDFKHSVDLDRQEWHRRMAMLADAFQGETVQQFIELRNTVVKTVTNIHYQFNRVEINIFDERFRQLEELLQRMYAERSRWERENPGAAQSQATLPEPEAQNALPAPQSHPSLTGPSAQAALTGPSAQAALPAPQAQAALPEPQSQAALEGPKAPLALPAPANPEQPALSAPPEQLALPAPAAQNLPLQPQSLQPQDAAAAASALLMPTDSSDDDDDDGLGEKNKPGPSGVKDVSALQKRVENMMTKSKVDVRRLRGAKQVKTRARDEIRTRQVTKRENKNNKIRDLDGI